jgi:peptide chain release factor subunit 1
LLRPKGPFFHCAETIIKILTKEQEKDRSHFVDAETSTDLEVVEQKSLLEWLAEEYTKFGCTLEFVTNKSQEGSQFCRGFGGIGGERPGCSLVTGGGRVLHF